MDTLFQEIKRRNVTRVTLAYLAVSWLVIQVADIVLDAFGFADWVMKALIVLFAVGLPIVVALAWIYDLTPEGVVRTDDTDPALAPVRRGGRRLDFVIIAVLSLALVALAIDRKLIPATPAALGPQSLVVLPFSSNQGEPLQVFADGLLGEILTRLYRIEGLTTIGRKTTESYRLSDKPVGEIAGELGVAAVMSGHLLEAAGQVRLDVELLEARSGKALWANSYTLPHSVRGLFEVQADVAMQVAAALQVTLTPGQRELAADRAEPAEAAYDHYLRGEGYRLRSRLEEAIEAYDQATITDPDFAAAWSALAIARADAHFFGTAPATLEQAQLALEQARRLAPDAVETQFASAVVMSYASGRESAMYLFQRVLERQPGEVEALIYLSGLCVEVPQMEQAREYAGKAVTLDPMNIKANWQLGYVLASMWSFGESRRYYDRAIALDPDTPHPWPFWMRYNVYLWGLGDTAAAAQILDQAPASIPTVYQRLRLAHLQRDALTMEQLLETTEGDSAYRHMMLARLHRLKGEVAIQRQHGEAMRAAAQRSLESLLDREAPAIDIDIARSVVAMAMALAGDEAGALRTMARAVEGADASRDRHNAAFVYENEVQMYAFLGHPAAAVDRLRDLLAWATPATLTPYRLKSDPDFDGLRDDPGFQAVLKEVSSKARY